jgi:hypothetical protein
LNSELNPFQSPSACSADDPTVRPTVRDPSGLKWLFGGLVVFIVCFYFMLVEFPEVCAYIDERSDVFPSSLRTVLTVNGFIVDHRAVVFLPAIFVVEINELCVRGAWKRKVRRVMGIGICSILFLFALWVAWAIVSTMP